MSRVPITVFELMGYDTAFAATLTALHLTLAILRRHRAGRRSALSPFVLPSFLFAATPWIWPSPLALAAGAAVHLLWMLACELLAPPQPRAVATSVTRSARVAGTTAAPAQAPSFVATPVLAVLEETPDIRTFRLARPPDFGFAAGQFIPVRVQIDGRPHVRCYSLSSSPDARGYLEISVRRQGLVSSTLHALLRPGSSLTIGRPAGRFVYPANDDRPIALVAGGVGITPLLCMLRYAVSSDPARPVTLLYSARREQDVAFLGELQLLAARHPQVRVALTLTKPDRDNRWRTGRIDAEMVRQHVTSPAQTIFCLCGPGGMLRDASALLASLGVPASQVRSEEFETAIAAASLHPAQDAPAAREEAAAGGGYRVTFAASGRVGTAAASHSLLDIAEASGVAIVSSCRAGVCQSCRTRLTGGDVDCRSDLLDPADRADGFILPCVSFAASDCVLEA